MDPVTAALLGMLLLLVVIGGVWGTMIIRSILERRSFQIGAPADEKRLEEILDDYRQLEARLGQLEEEVGFQRQLRGPEPRGQLPAVGNEGQKQAE